MYSTSCWNLDCYEIVQRKKYAIQKETIIHFLKGKKKKKKVIPHSHEDEEEK